MNCDIYQARHVRIIARFADDRTAVAVAHQDDRAVLLVRTRWMAATSSLNEVWGSCTSVTL